LRKKIKKKKNKQKKKNQPKRVIVPYVKRGQMREYLSTAGHEKSSGK
jgi:hypothetical protein